MFYIVQDFEEYYEMKFQRKPILTRKNVMDAGDASTKKGKKILLMVFYRQGSQFA